ncbi:hypothetical protein A3A66_00405 [Microgenomates group bacterium RIFCSPLOWO2_01_FULL_46_13]|nr:MAG: hypothetical protein A2783_03925 [Microgenomates group bacterium RIFCSPHIGHO2_01_FULL_45_11]OGV94476.1 MAG: hypothetical protein A3A66_00405 [Microgenomates group bacterium RIFCSPLOWO2_01_FULL_46_13]
MKKYLVQAWPNARANHIKEVSANVLKVKIAAPPIEGQADRELVRQLAKYFKVHRNEVTILKGMSARLKIVGIGGDE